jgi:coenzyme F420-reducing hydrogenase beta subunit
MYGSKVAPDATVSDISMASAVCPFSDDAKNETSLARDRFPALPEDDRIGRYDLVLAGRVTEDKTLIGSSSGGLTTFLLSELLDRGEVDGVIHVGRSDGSGLFEYRISRSVTDLVGSRKSVYYSVTLADVLNSVLRDRGRYAIVGVPCFIRAARLLADEVPELSSSLRYFVGLVCGHMKSRFFAESLGWQLGVAPEELNAIDFRVKDPTRGSDRYSYAVTSTTNLSPREAPVSTALDGNWGYAAFQPEACNFCDDIFAETADVVLGDAWLPQYTADWRGTNVVISRNEVTSEILCEAMDTELVAAERIPPSVAADTQSGNFRHRRDGLRLRLADDIGKELKVPKKRVSPGLSHITRRRAALVRARRGLSHLSLQRFADARAAQDLSRYTRPMRRGIRRYDLLSAVDRGLPGIVRFAIGPLRRAFTRS